MSDPENAEKVEVLLVEDNPGDIVLFMEALNETNARANLNTVEDGEEALSFLRRQGRYKYVPRPSLIILDLNLPKINGREVLQEIRRDPDFNAIPVVILTTSKSENDMLEAYRLHASCYIVKPVDLKNFISVLKQVTHFWLNVARLPMETQEL
jgi:two-component system, chemotaxis family, response regulator Rcp1